jgi:hypothetical protein
MSYRSLRYLLLGLLGLCLAGCASQPRRDLANLPGKNACFWTRTLFDWTVVNDSTILVHAPSPRDAYLIELFYPIPGLTLDEVVLGFQGGDGEPGQFCRENGYVIVPGPVRDREPVIAVQALTPDEAKQLLASTRGRAPHRVASKPAAPAN